ncbi:30S ribosome-binding factor RbfA [Chloroflexota bacterium]
MSYRIERVNSLIRQEISDMLQRQVKDPRLDNFITVTGVATSTDLKYARVFVSYISTEVNKQAVLDGLASASGFLRRELAKRMKLRHIPELNFQWDDSIERADRLSKLIDDVIQDNSSS